MRWAMMGLLLASCTSSTRGGTTTGNGGDDGGLILSEDGGGMSGEDLSMSMSMLPDLSGGGSAYSDLATGDASGCAPGAMGPVCANAVPANAGCIAVEDCGGAGGRGNGLDDDCNGLIDDGCNCIPGEVQRCFAGPPGKRGVGGCTDGTQTCEGAQEFGSWGACVGSIGPGPESCDMLDNDCNGCPDDAVCCQGGAIDCPSPGDPRIPPVAPFTTVALNGGAFFTGPALTWSWKIEGGPCDRLFASTSGKQSFTLSNANMQNASATFRLSGDYTVTLTVTDTTGMVFTCTWVQHVVGPGVRFELCWDHQGKVMQGGADLDLHVHKSGSTTDWFRTLNGGNPAKINPDDCYYYNCTAPRFLSPPIDPFSMMTMELPKWYGTSPLSNCQGSKNGNTWKFVGSCNNPRLDIDNVSDQGVPENTNIDNPANGDKFRVAVHYFGQSNTASTNSIVEHPIVNVYCGGNLKATYGQAPDQISGFDWGSGWGKGQLWRVADVTAIVDGSGITTDCTIDALHPGATTSGYWVVTDRNNTDFTY